MDEIGTLFADFEAELRAISDEYGGTVNVHRPEKAEIVELQPPSPSETPADLDPDDDRGLGEVIQFDLEIDDETTMH